MSDTLSGYELCRVLSRAVETELKPHISDSETWISPSATWARVSAQMTDGRYLFVQLNIEISTDTANENGGPDKA